MRYNDDVINAESWNTGLKKTVLRSEKHEPVKGRQTTAKNMRVSKQDSVRITKANPSFANIHTSKSRMSRRKKRGTFLLSGLLTGLAYRSRSHK
ncbi:MAG: hypothetical protein HZC49_14005 [Nitrospirae bacterium]|nr:hypothetical protein [Nitrospirota bacterium]